MHPFNQFGYCPKCGSVQFLIHNEKAKKCHSCGFTYYFNSSAACVAFICNSKNELLLVERAKDPAKGTLDLPGGFIDLNETGEEAVAREVLEETGLVVTAANYLFSLPNTYLYSDFLVHTLDLFYECKTAPFNHLQASDDVAKSCFVPMNNINPADFGLESIKKGVGWYLKGQYSTNR